MTADNHTGDILNALGKEMDNAVTEYIDRLELKTPHSIKKKNTLQKKNNYSCCNYCCASLIRHRCIKQYKNI